MPAMLEQLVAVRSQLVEDVLAYLDALAEGAAELPKYYPAHLRTDEAGKTRFDDIRQMVQVVEDRSAFEQWLKEEAEERERMQAAGLDFNRRAYGPTRALPDEADDERDSMRSDRPAPPPPVPWDECAGERFKRAVILGDPGFGKTWLLRYEARRLAGDAAQKLRHQTISLDDLILPIFARLSDVNRSDDQLENALVKLVGERRSEAFRKFVWEKLETDHCVVLLDAWDEVPVEVTKDGQPIAYLPHHRQRLGQRLEAFARQFSQPRLLLTSRIVGYTKSPIPDAEELELLAFETIQIEFFVRVWFGEDTQTANQFLAMLRQNHQVRGLARIPLMLALMCRAYQEKELVFPTRRVELYDHCLRGLLRDWKEEKDYAVSDAYVDALLELLQAIGYVLFADGYEQFSESLLRKNIGAWLDGLKRTHELSHRNPTSLIAELKRDGILITAGEHRDTPLLFLHRTFHEYLTACALAVQLEDENRNAEGGSLPSHPVWALVDKKAWLPQWQEVIILLAGKLNDPVPLLEMLSNPEATPTNPYGDDIFRHRLGLAALCLPELSSKVREAQAEIVDHITTDAFSLCTDAFSLWGQHPMNDTDDAVHPLTRALAELGGVKGAPPGLGQVNRALPALGQVNGRMNDTPLLLWLCQKLGDENVNVWTEVYAAIGNIGSAAATPDILDRLADLMQHEKEDVREAAADAVGGLGSAAATPDILAGLADLMLDEKWDVRWSAAYALGDIGSAAATPDILDRLADLMLHEGKDVRQAAARVVGDIGSAAATPDILARLADLMQDGSKEVRETAAEAVGGIGSAAATPDILAQLADLMQDEKEDVQKAAAIAVGGIGSAAATPEFLARLVDLMQDEKENVREAAAKALRRLMIQDMRIFEPQPGKWEGRSVKELSQC